MKRFIAILLTALIFVFGMVPVSAVNPETTVFGDVDRDGKLTIKDATLIRKHIAKIIVMTEDQINLADTDYNSKISIADATLIQKKIASVIGKLPVETTEPATQTTAHAESDRETLCTEASEYISEVPETEVSETVTSTASEAETESTLTATEPAEFSEPVLTTCVTEPVEITVASTESTDVEVPPTEAVETESEAEEPTEEPTEITHPSTDTTPPETTIACSEPVETTPTVNMENFGPKDTIEGDIVTAEMLWKIEEIFYNLVNEERESLGLHPLAYNKHLDDVAELRSKEIISVFAHTRPDGKGFPSAIDTEKYLYRTAGENICWFYHLSGTVTFDELIFTGSDKQIEKAARIVFESFKGSPGHYANMTRETFEDAGIGISYIWDTELDLPRFYLSHNFGAEM